MRMILIAGISLVSSMVPGAALAWDGATLWFDSATGANPGGGGIIGTGGARDFNVTCAHCHTGSASKIDAKVEMSPALGSVGGQATYAPGQTYQVTISLLGEHLGTGACDQYMMRTNNAAVTVEDASGKTAGAFASDVGETTANCPEKPMDPKSGTTTLHGDCHAVVSNGMENMTAWSFAWTAPASGAGPLTLYYGVVDGNCDMMSMGDDVKMGTIKLGEATASLAPGGAQASRSALAALSGAPALPYALGVLPLAGLVFAFARRRRR